MHSLNRFFVRAAGVILGVTALAKIVSIFSSAPLMLMEDPLLGISFRYLLLLAGIAELAVAVSCFSSRNVKRNILFIAWLSTLFLTYRFGLWLIDWHRPCHCLGHLTELLHMRPQMADNMMKAVLLFLLVGSYAGVISFWRQSQTTLGVSHETANA